MSTADKQCDDMEMLNGAENSNKAAGYWKSDLLLLDDADISSILNVFSYSCCLLLLSYRRFGCFDDYYCCVMSDYCNLWHIFVVAVVVVCWSSKMLD